MTRSRPTSLAPALLLTFLVVAVRVDAHGATWFWQGQEPAAVILGVWSLVMWGLVVRQVRGRGRTDPRASAGG
jgi:hypothetical protein